MAGNLKYRVVSKVPSGASRVDWTGPRRRRWVWVFLVGIAAVVLVAALRRVRDSGPSTEVVPPVPKETGTGTGGAGQVRNSGPSTEVVPPVTKEAGTGTGGRGQAGGGAPAGGNTGAGGVEASGGGLPAAPLSVRLLDARGELALAIDLPADSRSGRLREQLQVRGTVPARVEGMSDRTALGGIVEAASGEGSGGTSGLRVVFRPVGTSREDALVALFNARIQAGCRLVIPGGGLPEDRYEYPIALPLEGGSRP